MRVALLLGVFLLLSGAAPAQAATSSLLGIDREISPGITEVALHCGRYAHYVHGHHARSGHWIRGHCVRNHHYY